VEINSNDVSILVVDDSINNIELLSEILCDDYNVLFATSGQKALKMISRSLPDLILLDIVMPQMDGYQVITELKANPEAKHIPIIFITAKSTTDDMVKGFKMGAVDYISKPFEVEEVKVRVKTHVQNRLLLKALKKANQKLHHISRVDGLTGIANRRYFDEFLQQTVNRCKRHNRPITLIIIDIDFFKLYNDHYGHQQGDICLTNVAQKLNLFGQRNSELTARYGGEEFAIILSEVTVNEAKKHANKCLHAIESLKIEHVKSTCKPYVTISMGMVTLTSGDIISSQNLIEKADAALYKAKESGRNQIHIYKENS